MADIPSALAAILLIVRFSAQAPQKGKPHKQLNYWRNVAMARLPVLLRSLVPLLVGACATPHEVAEKGRQTIVGMDVDSLQSCAGIPTRTKHLNARTELYSYEIKYEKSGGTQITLPIIGGGFSVGGSGSYCHAIVRVVDGKVAAVNYTGDNDDVTGRDAVCAPIVRGCLRLYETELHGTATASR
jgi:hypothetical protein